MINVDDDDDVIMYVSKSLEDKFLVSSLLRSPCKCESEPNSSDWIDFVHKTIDFRFYS